ncbi:MAG: glycosyltransferase family 4 protein [Planctomycetota bacterium]
MPDGISGCAETSPKYRLLLLAPFPVFPPRHGGAACVRALTAALAKRQEVRLLTPGPPPPPESRVVPVEAFSLGPLTRPLRAMGPSFSRRFKRAARRAASAHRAHIVQAETLWACEAAHAACRTLGCPFVFTAHNAESEKLRSLGFSPSVVAITRWLERRAAHRADAIVAFAAEDRRLLAQHHKLGSEKVVRIPAPAGLTPAVGSEARRALRDKWGIPPEAAVLLFVGHLDYRPNAEALEVLRNELAPPLARARERVIFLIVGRGGVASPARHDPMFRFTGLVSDTALTELLQIADIVPAPIQQGSGVSIKVLEALGAGCAVVTTTAGIRGLDVSPGHELLVEDEIDGFARAVATLLGSVERRRELGEHGRRYVTARHSPDAVATLYERIYERLVEQRKGSEPRQSL